MIVVRVELHSAITGKTTEIGRAVIHNTGGTRERGDYEVRAFKGRDDKPWTRADFNAFWQNPLRKGEVKNYPRLSLHVWNLVARALASMGYK